MLPYVRKHAFPHTIDFLRLQLSLCLWASRPSVWQCSMSGDSFKLARTTFVLFKVRSELGDIVPKA